MRQTKHYIFDVISITGGHELGWLHLDTDKHIDPENLFMDTHDMEECAKDIVMDGESTYTNYFFDSEWIQEWEDERDRCEECDGEGTIISPTYDDPYNEEFCPECHDDGSDLKYELSKDK